MGDAVRSPRAVACERIQNRGAHARWADRRTPRHVRARQRFEADAIARAIRRGLSHIARSDSVDPSTAWAGTGARPRRRIVWAVPGFPLSLVEFPADDPERARRFWTGLFGVELQARQDGEGEGWQTHSGAPEVGVHARGRGPGDSFSLPYLVVSDVAEALARVEELGGSVVHPGDAWAICKDSEGSPFGLAQEDPLRGR